jgi:hypothetical protein
MDNKEKAIDEARSPCHTFPAQHRTGECFAFSAAGIDAFLCQTEMIRTIAHAPE